MSIYLCVIMLVLVLLCVCFYSPTTALPPSLSLPQTNHPQALLVRLLLPPLPIPPQSCLLSTHRPSDLEASEPVGLALAVALACYSVQPQFWHHSGWAWLFAALAPFMPVIPKLLATDTAWAAPFR